MKAHTEPAAPVGLRSPKGLGRAGAGVKAGEATLLPRRPRTFTFFSRDESRQHCERDRREGSCFQLACSGRVPSHPPLGTRQAAGHSPSGLRQKSVEATPCSLWMVHRYTPQSTGDACTMAKAAGPSSPALHRVGSLCDSLSRAQGQTCSLGAPQPSSEAALHPGSRELWEVQEFSSVFEGHPGSMHVWISALTHMGTNLRKGTQALWASILSSLPWE